MSDIDIGYWYTNNILAWHCPKETADTDLFISIDFLVGKNSIEPGCNLAFFLAIRIRKAVWFRGSNY